MASGLLVACGGPPKARLEEQRQQQTFAAQGYPAQAEAVTVLAQQWRLKNDVFRLNLTIGSAYASGPARPVVVYLPGLGESENAGQKWRQAWAAAGYAVLSVQPLEADAQAWASDLARAAEFKRLGQQHYAEAMLRQRLTTLDALVAEARRLGQAGETPWRALDWSRAAVAGYELGAQAAMTIAGEPLADGTTMALRNFQPKAVVVVSPQVMANPPAERFRQLQLPVLGLTGPNDDDVIGLVQQTSWRTLPFDAMPTDKAWLLSLGGITHSALAGNEAPAQAVAQGRNGESADSSGRAGGGGGGGGRRGGGGGGMGGGPGGGMGAGNRMLQPVPNQPDWRGLHEAQLAFIAAQQTSTAFLDWQLKQSPAARNWLTGPAQGWLGHTGQLTAPLR
ncbi:hypothetical protein SAMN05216359_101230 [Roseateles sp. YR242]|uniref:hypothetical protein n=1 Tax=Roseateles sp. YR242 TaxID=1855305 RepID=UPI0008CA17BC|nr:hypothetical protein [Roseateles sp. YR242]SEK26621.1 hypothetical protein SAMN05216359_101230 [Roseateles sp. YR242]